MDTELLDSVRQLLEEKTRTFNHSEFIREDPIQVPHLFSRRENIEIAAFMTATIAWGRRDTIIKNALDLMSRMDHDPYAFLMNLKKEDLNVFKGFRHRTFNEQDCRFFMQSLHRIYKHRGGLYKVFLDGYRGKGASSRPSWNSGISFSALSTPLARKNTWQIRTVALLQRD